MHTRVRDTSLGFDGLVTFARNRQAFMGTLHVACQFVLPGKAVFSTEPAADDMAWEPFGILAMNGRVVSFHVVFALGTDMTAVIFAGEDQLSVMVKSLLAEMTFFMEHGHQIWVPIVTAKDVLSPSTSFNTAGYVV